MMTLEERKKTAWDRWSKSDGVTLWEWIAEEIENAASDAAAAQAEKDKAESQAWKSASDIMESNLNKAKLVHAHELAKIKSHFRRQEAENKRQAYENAAQICNNMPTKNMEEVDLMVKAMDAIRRYAEKKTVVRRIDPDPFYKCCCCHLPNKDYRCVYCLGCEAPTTSQDGWCDKCSKLCLPVPPISQDVCPQCRYPYRNWGCFPGFCVRQLGAKMSLNSYSGSSSKGWIHLEVGIE